MQTSIARPVVLAPTSVFCQRPAKASRRQLQVVRAEPQQEGGEAPAAEPKPTPRSAYIDELPEIQRTELSPEMKARLKKEYYSLGGAPNTKMGANWFLNIGLFIAGLAILSWLTGAI